MRADVLLGAQMAEEQDKEFCYEFSDVSAVSHGGIVSMFLMTKPVAWLPTPVVAG